jgi:repressor LexA
MTDTEGKVLPTKKQKELLGFIDAFINEKGYSPSYREIMNGLEYNSVATVALHVNSLIKRGHLRKRDRSARSLEVVTPQAGASLKTNEVKEGQEKWLVDKVEYFFQRLEQEGGKVEQQAIDELYVLIGALKVLGLNGAAQSFVPRLQTIKQRL